MNHFDLNLDNLRIQWLVYWLKQSIKVILNHNNTRLTILYSAMTEKSTLFKFFEYFCCHNDQVVVWAVILIFPYFNPHLFASALCIASCYFTFYQQRSLLQTWSSVPNIYSVYSFVYICTGHHHFVLDQGILTMIAFDFMWKRFKYLCEGIYAS